MSNVTRFIARRAWRRTPRRRDPKTGERARCDWRDWRRTPRRDFLDEFVDECSQEDPRFPELLVAATTKRNVAHAPGFE